MREKYQIEIEKRIDGFVDGYVFSAIDFAVIPDRTIIGCEGSWERLWVKILVVIDMQEKYLGDYETDLLNMINSRIKEFLDAENPVFYVRNSPSKEGVTSYPFADGLFVSSNYIFDKVLLSAFINQLFVDVLKELGATTIEVIGIDGNCCVKKTCLDAKAAGYEVILKLSCMGGRSEKIFEKTKCVLETEGIVIVK